MRIDKLSKHKIKQILVERYATTIKQNVKEALGKMKVELDKLTEIQKEKETENTINNSRMRIFISLDDMVSKCRQRLQRFENM